MLFSRLSEPPNLLCSVSVCHNRWCHLPPTGSHRFISSPHPQPTSPQRAPALCSYWHCSQWSWVQDLIYLRAMGVPSPIPLQLPGISFGWGCPSPSPLLASEGGALRSSGAVQLHSTANFCKVTCCSWPPFPWWRRK